MSPPLTIDELKTATENGSVDTVLIAITDMQGRLQGKRADAGYFLEPTLCRHAAEGATTCSPSTSNEYGRRLCESSWERGYGDFVMRPDLATLRMFPWHPGTALASPTSSGRTARVSSPRPGRSSDDSSPDSPSVRWTANGATELEFMIFHDTYEEAWHKATAGLVPANQYNVDYSIMGRPASSHLSGGSATR